MKNLLLDLASLSARLESPIAIEFERPVKEPGHGED